jgi:hypothetical protein
MLQDNAFKGTREGNPTRHLREFTHYYETFGPRCLDKEYTLLKLFRWSLKDLASEWFVSLAHGSINSLTKMARIFTRRFTSFKEMMDTKISITNFVQKNGESYWQAYSRFCEIINLVTNHGFAEFAIIEFFYLGLNNESKLMIDACAGGLLRNLTLKDCEDLFAKRAFNDEQYNPTTDIKKANGIIFVPQYLIPEEAKSMEEKGIPAELVKDNIVDTFQNLKEEYELKESIEHYKE